jgi:5-methyltetrahydropteroyltriglutamate--homocysteine methyltransferase
MSRIQTTMTGSWFRTQEIRRLLETKTCPTGEISDMHSEQLHVSETRAIRDQLNAAGNSRGLDWISNGEQRKAGYSMYLPNRFAGFSKSEKVTIPVLPSFIEEMDESNPKSLEERRQGNNSFTAARIESKLQYIGEVFAKREAEAALELAKAEGADRIFIPSPSPGVVTICFPRTEVYPSHEEYLFSVAREMRREYEVILSAGVDLQIDAPDLAMAKQRGIVGVDFFQVLSQHVDAINESIKGLPRERIRVHYCYGNWVGSHKFDADFRRLLPEIMRLQVGTIVGEMANPRHEGDALILEEYLQENSWPSNTKFAIGVIDVKTPVVETPQTVAAKIERVGRIEKLDPKFLFAGTDCGFETFAGFGNVSYPIGKLKLKALVEGAELASQRLGLN